MPNPPLSDDAVAVTLVVDSEFGDHLSEVAAMGAVWIVESSTNRSVVERHWKANPNTNHLEGVTIFDACGVKDPASIVANVLDTIDLHHGQYSSASPYTELHVIGANRTPSLELELAKFDLCDTATKAGGFRARRSASGAVNRLQPAVRPPNDAQ
jgi:hypothetical protein